MIRPPTGLMKSPAAKRLRMRGAGAPLVPSPNARTECLSFEGLVGRLPNDVESKNVPDRLFVSGRLATPLELSRVSIVGTRTPSEEGKDMARMTASMVVRNEYAVVSGLARGIDTVAHRTAIAAGGQTIAVLGTP